MVEESPRCPICNDPVDKPGICAECIALETRSPDDPNVKTNGVKDQSEEQVLGPDDTIDHFNEYLQQAWDDLASQNITVSFPGYQFFAQQVVAQFIIKLTLENDVNEIVAYHIICRNIRNIVAAHLQSKGKDTNL